MLSTVDYYVIARDRNVLRVDFSRPPDPPAPCFPGANGLRLSHAERDEADAPAAIAIRGAGTRFQSATNVRRSACMAVSENSARRLELRAQSLIDGEELIIMKESDIMGVLDEPAARKKAA
jgi:co-chaperonin GroES (HSP10)